MQCTHHSPGSFHPLLQHWPARLPKLSPGDVKVVFESRVLLAGFCLLK